MRTVLDEGSILGVIADLTGSVEKSGAKGVANFFKDKNKNRSKSDAARMFTGGSVAKYAKDLTMTFPALIDNSLSPDTASMISKANERNIVSMLQMLFASMQITGTDGREIIKQIYGNKNRIGSMSYDDYMNAFKNFARDNGIDSKVFESACLTEDDMAEFVKKMHDELVRPIKSFPTNSFSDNSLNDYSVLNINGTEVVKFAPVKEARNDDMDINEDPEYAEWLKKYGYAPDKDFGFFRQDPRNLRTKGKEYVDQYNQATNYKYNRQNQVDQMNLAKDKFEHQKKMDQAKIWQMRAQMAKDNQDLISRQLLDSDVKKANEMQPTLMIINFSEVDPNDEYKIIDQRSFVAGVKSRLIPVSSSDILERIVAKNKTRVNFLNFIRATTGEISFMKDFILCLKQAKIDAKNSIKRGQAAQMWKTLESLSTKNNRNKLRQSGNDASAITTLVINQETANLIAKQYDINVENVNTAKQIMNDYNLLGIIIADESIEIVKFLYDGQDMFEQQAYSFLEKENSDKSYKKIINLMSQNRRF